MAVAEERKKVVVVGGGVGGSLVAKSLQFSADVVLIDQKEYFEIPWAALRSKVEPSVAERTVVSNRDYFISGRIYLPTSRKVEINGSMDYKMEFPDEYPLHSEN